MRALKMAAVAALALGLAACAEEPLPTPQPEEAASQPQAAVTDDQLDTVLERIGTALAAADANSDAEAFADRVVGPAATMRAAEYKLASLTDGDNTVTPLSTDPQVAIVTQSQEWPRAIDVVTEIPEGENLPLLLTLVQDEAQDNYALWAWVRLLPGTEMPATAVSGIGSPQLAADADTLQVSPSDAVAQYVDVLNSGDDSEYAAAFAADVFREGYAEETSTLDAAVSDAGEVTRTATVDDAGTQTLATTDGGAIVMAVIDSDLVVTRTVANATLTVGTELAWGGEDEVEGSLTAHYLITVALYVPPQDSEDQIRVLGAEQVLCDVERDDSVSPD